jgi:hypothetical protein
MHELGKLAFMDIFLHAVEHGAKALGMKLVAKAIPITAIADGWPVLQNHTSFPKKDTTSKMRY